MSHLKGLMDALLQWAQVSCHSSLGTLVLTKTLKRKRLWSSMNWPFLWHMSNHPWVKLNAAMLRRGKERRWRLWKDHNLRTVHIEICQLSVCNGRSVSRKIQSRKKQTRLHSVVWSLMDIWTWLASLIPISGLKSAITLIRNHANFQQFLSICSNRWRRTSHVKLALQNSKEICSSTIRNE